MKLHRCGVRKASDLAKSEVVSKTTGGLGHRRFGSERERERDSRIKQLKQDVLDEFAVIAKTIQLSVPTRGLWISTDAKQSLIAQN